MERRTVFSWLFAGALFVLCGFLGVLQYRWLGEVSVAERELFQHLFQTPESRALRHAFFAERAASKVPGVPDDTPARPLKLAAVPLPFTQPKFRGLPAKVVTTPVGVTFRIVELTASAT